MTYQITRRNFLGKLIAGFGILAGGCSERIIWPVSGSDKGPIRLVFYTDVHSRVEWETPVALERAVDAINSANADLVIAGGDLITDGFQSSASQVAPRWDAYMKMHRGIKADLYPTIGNHDLVAANPQDGSAAAQDPRKVYLAEMGLDQTYYSFDAAGYHFVILDSIQVTNDRYQYQGFIEPEQMEWLKRDIAKVSPNTPIVMVTHIPILTAFFSATLGATAKAPKNRIITNNVEVLKIIENHNVILVLQGHLHVKERIKWRDTSYIVGGAICGKWWRGHYYDTAEGFNVITLTGNRVVWEYKEYGWQARRP